MYGKDRYNVNNLRFAENEGRRWMVLSDCIAGMIWCVQYFFDAKCIL